MIMRGHHLLILDIFAHHPQEHDTLRQATLLSGYGPQHYERVVRPNLQRILDNPELNIKVGSELGALCHGCLAKRPDCLGSVRNFDTRILKDLELEPGQTITARDLLGKVHGHGIEEMRRIREL